MTQVRKYVRKTAPWPHETRVQRCLRRLPNAPSRCITPSEVAVNAGIRSAAEVEIKRREKLAV